MLDVSVDFESSHDWLECLWIRPDILGMIVACNDDLLWPYLHRGALAFRLKWIVVSPYLDVITQA